MTKWSDKKHFIKKHFILKHFKILHDVGEVLKF